MGNRFKSLMIQGTASSVGKSLVCAGLCRVFMQDGYHVAPFKSQNMALNSFVTKNGKEMGRAQVVQAEAAGIEPSVEMNPVLLKPTTDRKSQVVLNGEVFRNMSAAEYHDFKPQLAEMVKETYMKLGEKNDIIIVEGAGSPAEINLRENDIVNMGMAEIADAPVILVGDIDRGGVFASIAGTMLLLTEEEKKRVKGVIINKFRGDVEILKPGLKMLEDIIKVPVLGVLPYMKHNIDDEDSVSEILDVEKSNDKAEIDIAVIKLPHISNFTDFNVFKNIPGVMIRYVESISEMDNPDMIIIPGTKNTIGDLSVLRSSGLESMIIDKNKQGTLVFGICGGYQMLGMAINDPYKVESDMRFVRGIGLLNIETEFGETKATTQVEAEITDKSTDIFQNNENLKLQGYEIHMGVTRHLPGCVPYLKITKSLGEECEIIDGVRNKNGTAFGSYIHGIFDNIVFTISLINSIRVKKGLCKIKYDNINYQTHKETEYNRLADMVRYNLDMEAIYNIIG